MKIAEFRTLRQSLSPKEYCEKYKLDLESTFPNPEDIKWVLNYGGSYIEELTNGDFYLIIENEQWTSKDIRQLERKLLKWANGMKIFE